MAICKDANGKISTPPGPTCPPGTTPAVGGGGGDNTNGGQQSSSPTPDDSKGAWMPKPKEALNIQGGGYGLEQQLADPNNYSASVPTSTANTMYMMFPQYSGLFTAIAKAQGGRSGSAAYEKFVTQSAYYNSIGIRKSPFQLAEEYAIKHKIQPLGPGGGPGSGGSGAAGPKPYDESSIRKAMDSVSTNLIGRTLSDKEFKQYYNSYTKDFSGNPDLDYQQHEMDAIKKEEDYQEQQVAQKFSKAFDSVLKGAM